MFTFIDKSYLKEWNSHVNFTIEFITISIGNGCREDSIVTISYKEHKFGEMEQISASLNRKSSIVFTHERYIDTRIEGKLTRCFRITRFHVCSTIDRKFLNQFLDNRRSFSVVDIPWNFSERKDIRKEFHPWD